MSGSVEKVQSLLPEGLAGQDVQVMAICAFRKAGVHQVQHTPQHQGEMGFFFGSQRPQGKGAGNVGGPFQVLARRNPPGTVPGVLGGCRFPG